MELADTIQAERARRGKPEPVPANVDRATPRWQRIRGSLCPHHGLRNMTLDEYADLVVGAIATATALAGASIPGDACEGQEVTA